LKDNIIIKLSERDHVLRRSGQYIGSIDEIKSEEFIITGEKIEKKEIEYVPALIKIINEILDNSIDEAVRTNYKFANRIDVKMNSVLVDIKDNGRGIPIVKVEGTDKYGPDIAFCEARAGANFDDGDRQTIGMNGVGSFATNCFSLKFNVDTADGKNKFSLKCKNNLEHASHKITKSSLKYTQVKFEPDLKRFSLEEITPIYMDLIKQRLSYLSVSHPNIRFTFNGKVVKFKNGKDLVKKFSDTYEIIERDDYFISVIPSPSDDFSYFTYVNGLYIKNGGNHIDYITNEIVSRLREKLNRRYKGIKPGDIKNKIQIIMFMNHFPDARFSSQTKEQLTNGFPHIKEYLSLSNEDLDKFVAKIYKNKILIDDITETYRVKEELKKRKELKEMSKTKKRLNIDKYFPSSGNNKYLVLCEGDCLHEDEKIKIIKNNSIIDIKIKDVKVGDMVLTHNHNIKQVLNKSSSIKQKGIIKTKNNEIIASHTHKLFVYNKQTQIFEFIQLKNIDKTKHFLIKSKLGNIQFSSTINSIDKIKKINNKYNYRIVTEDGEILSSATHKFLILIPEELKFYLIMTKNLKPDMNIVLVEGDSI